MKRAFTFILTSVAILSSGQAIAQIEDNDASKNLLAMQCSMSSGHPPSNYEEYCRKLAKTVGLLNPSQQERVFGYLPRPAVVASGDLNGYGIASPSGGAAEGNASPSSNPLVAIVGDFNNAISGNNDESGTIVGGTPPQQSPDTVDPDADLDPNQPTDWWSGLLNWWSGVVESIENSRAQKG